jgi:hypothetical protein
MAFTENDAYARNSTGDSTPGRNSTTSSTNGTMSPSITPFSRQYTELPTGPPSTMNSSSHVTLRRKSSVKQYEYSKKYWDRFVAENGFNPVDAISWVDNNGEIKHNTTKWTMVRFIEYLDSLHVMTSSILSNILSWLQYELDRQIALKFGNRPDGWVRRLPRVKEAVKKYKQQLSSMTTHCPETGEIIGWRDNLAHLESDMTRVQMMQAVCVCFQTDERDQRKLLFNPLLALNTIAELRKTHQEASRMEDLR